MLEKVDRLFARFAPAPCVLCGLGCRRGVLCGACLDDLPWIPAGCTRCGAPLPPGAAVGRCAGCDLVLQGLDRVRAALVYEYPVDGLVAAAKFRGRTECARALGEALALALRRDPALLRPDLLVPVPLHPARMGRRGYNQSALIAAIASRVVRLRCDHRACARRRNTRAQSELAAGARRANVRGAFVARQDLARLAVVIVDDVVTTGHTLSALACTLRHAGAARVEAWCAARVVRV